MIKEEKPKVPCCDRFLIHPDKRPKMAFDFIIILFAVWNAIMVPYEAAYGDINSLLFDICDRIIDVFFFIDILVNFRTMY